VKTSILARDRFEVGAVGDVQESPALVLGEPAGEPAVGDVDELVDPWSVAVESDGLWVVEDGGAVAQRFDR
jgi:hypothetical protein